MDDISMNKLGSAPFGKLGSIPDPSHQAVRELKPPANQPTVLSRRVVLHPPERIISSSKSQRKPVDIFKKLVAKSETSFTTKSGTKPQVSSLDKKRQRRDASWEGEWRVDPPPFVIPCPTPVFSQARLDLGALPSSNTEQPQSSASPPGYDLGRPIYRPNAALLDALSLRFDHVLSIEPTSVSQPTTTRDTKRRVQEASFALSSISYSSLGSLPSVPTRVSLIPQPMALSPPPRKSKGPRRKTPGGDSSQPFRKPASSSRRTSRSRMIATPPPNSRGKPPTDPSDRRSSTGSQISTNLTGSSKNDHRRSSRHMQELRRQSIKRQSSLSMDRLVLPPIELPSLTFSPLLLEFGDRIGGSLGGSSTPSIKTPESTVTTLSLSIMAQSTTLAQKSSRRNGRVPSMLLNLDPITPVAPLPSPDTRQFRNDDIPSDLILPADTSAATTGKGPSSHQGLYGGSEVSVEIESKPTAATPPKLILQVPQYSATIQSTAHQPVTGVAKLTGDMWPTNTRKVRPLPPIPVIRQATV